MTKTATRKTATPTKTRTRPSGKANPATKTRSRATRSLRPLTKSDIDRWMKWWDFNKPDSTLNPRLRTVDQGIAGALLNLYRGRWGNDEKGPDRLPWSTIAMLATKAEGSGTMFAKERVVWAGIIADWAFRCAAPAWLALLPKDASFRYDSGLVPRLPCWWSADLIQNMDRIVWIMADLECSMKATTQARTRLLSTVRGRLRVVLQVGYEALGFILDKAGQNDRLPTWSHLVLPAPGDSPHACDVATRVAATVPELLELVVTTRAGDALEYVRDRCIWPDLTAPAKSKSRKAA